LPTLSQLQVAVQPDIWRIIQIKRASQRQRLILIKKSMPEARFSASDME
jgi:hypothetical protein